MENDKLERIPAEVAAGIVGITTKNVITLTTRKILKGKREPLGERKGAYYFTFGEVFFLAVLVRFQKKFSIRYTDSLTWKKRIIEAMTNGDALVLIDSEGKVESIGSDMQGMATMIDLNAIMKRDVSIFLNVKKLRRELTEKINSWA